MRNAHIAVLAIGLLLFSEGLCLGAFNDIGVGARPLGMGGAFVALADDANAASYNAAGLGYIDAPQLGFTNAQQFAGLITYNYIGGVLPLGRAGTLGASVGILGEDAGIYKEQTLVLSYGRAFSQRLSLGVNLKSLGISFDEDNESVRENPYFADTSASAVSLDLGAMVKLVTGLTVGVSAENLLPADVSISASEEDEVPMNLRVGLAYNLAGIAESTQQAALREVLKSATGLLEVAFRDGERQAHVGAEVWLNKVVGVRAGYGAKSGVNSTTTLALGGSARIPISQIHLQLDYAFQILTGDLEDNTTQRFSLNLVF